MEEKNINVLYIDDEVQNIVSFRAAFRRIFTVFTAESAEAGRKILDENHNENPIQIILSDQRMPQMTGIEFFQSIIPIYPDPIRILITGYTDISAVIDAINVGQVYKYLSKPWVEEDVKNYIYKAFEIFELRRKNVELTDKLVDANDKLEFLARQSLLS
ncbi:MAG: response regulator [Chitinophagaceae bacterium]|nr:response regulator [Chitinophagaceae bacterium]